MEKKFSRDHLWVLPKKRGGKTTAKIGVTEFFITKYGLVEEITLPDPEESFETGETMGEIVTEKEGAVDIIAPVEGEVIDINAEITESPDILNDDPESEDSWLIEIEVSDPAELESLLDEESYEEMIEEEEGEVLEEELEEEEEEEFEEEYEEEFEEEPEDEEEE